MLSTRAVPVVLCGDEVQKVQHLRLSLVRCSVMEMIQAFMMRHDAASAADDPTRRLRPAETPASACAQLMTACRACEHRDLFAMPDVKGTAGSFEPHAPK